MIKKIYYINNSSLIPYVNQATEEHLLQKVKPGELILFLWQNKKTVVIGLNQNCWRECRVEQLLADQGYPARRLSGGGAVFHDLGNLNFTFITHDQDYNVNRQQEVIIHALSRFGIDAYHSGRNDVLVDGRKFSGNAYYRSGSRRFHHGTLMVDVDIDDLERYLQPPIHKLKAKGIASVRSRVLNLQDLAPQLQIDALRRQLIYSLEQIYGLKPELLQLSESEQIQISLLEQRYADWGWIYDKNSDFDVEMAGYFPWGSLNINLRIIQGRIWQAVIYSDAMEGELIVSLTDALKSCIYMAKEMVKCLRVVKTETAAEKQIVDDICQWLLQQQ
jgi:lipoate-protein ligase A